MIGSIVLTSEVAEEMAPYCAALRQSQVTCIKACYLDACLGIGDIQLLFQSILERSKGVLREG